MASRYSPPVLYLSDDDDHHHRTEQNIPYTSSLTLMNNDNLPRKKRKLIDTNVRINPSVVNWSKRQRNESHYQYQQATNHSIHPLSDPFVMNTDEYNLRNQQSHSFQAFDWTNELRTDSRIYSNPIQTSSRIPMVPPPPSPSNVMNVVKHHLDQSDTIPMMPLSHQNDRYVQNSQRKSIHIPIPAVLPPPPAPAPPLPLPLPTPTSSLVRPQTRRVQPEKNNRIPYTHSTSPPLPPPPPLIPVHRSIKPVFPNPTYRPPSPASISTPISTPEIRRQPLNGTGVLSAFYDSKYYRCNICKFKSVASSTLLQHLFTHTFFCHQCPFFSHSHYTLYQHIFEKHNTKLDKDNIDPKNLDLLYITRCTDGTFALCMDSSSPSPPLPPPLPPPPPPSAPPPSTVIKPIEKPINPSIKNNKPKATKKNALPKRKKEPNNDLIILSEKRDINLRQSPIITTPKRPVIKEKQPSTYVLMKHRRCYSIRYPTCLHSLVLEYSICREHTIRHMCHTQGALKRYKFKTKPKKHLLIDDVATCLKTVVNRIIEDEENSESSIPVCTLPNTILNLIFSTDDVNILTTYLKLNNKYDKSLDKKEQNQAEYSVRTSNQHIFILSSSGINKNEQSVFSSLKTSITNDDSIYTQTKLNTLPISYDNTLRFLKGNLNLARQSTNSIAKNSDIIPRPLSSRNIEPIDNTVSKRKRAMTASSTSLMFDKNNNSVTSVNPRLSPSPSVIVID